MGGAECRSMTLSFYLRGPARLHDGWGAKLRSRSCPGSSDSADPPCRLPGTKVHCARLVVMSRSRFGIGKAVL
eukprot:1669807-Prymnesium_polylepis.2